MNLFPSTPTLCLLAVSTILASCGGGGSASTATVDDKFSVATRTSYVSAATVGELVSYSVDPVNLTYEYEIIDSAYGKLGQTGSGTLTKNTDGTYTPSGMSGKIRLNANGTMIGAINDDFDGDGTAETVPVFGVSNPITSISEAAGIYNFVSYNCNSNSCYANYGTYEVKADGTWSSCNSADLRDGTASCQNPQTGTFNVVSASTGKVKLFDAGGSAMGTLVAHKDVSRDQKVMFIDLAHSMNGLGNGVVVGSEIGSVESSDVQGNWVYMNSQTGAGQLTVGSSSYTDTAVGSTPINLTFDTPWAGMATTGNGYKVLMAGTGMFAASFNEGGTEQISVGIKID